MSASATQPQKSPTDTLEDAAKRLFYTTGDATMHKDDTLTIMGENGETIHIGSELNATEAIALFQSLKKPAKKLPPYAALENKFSDLSEQRQTQDIIANAPYRAVIRSGTTQDSQNYKLNIGFLTANLLLCPKLQYLNSSHDFIPTFYEKTSPMEIVEFYGVNFPHYYTLMHQPTHKMTGGSQPISINENEARMLPHEAQKSYNARIAKMNALFDRHSGINRITEELKEDGWEPTDPLITLPKTHFTSYRT